MSEASSTQVLASAFATGLLFAIGLGISGMTDAQNVLNFLTIGPSWSPALMLVMGGAIGVHAIVYYFLRGPSPVFADTFQIPTRRDIDGRLIGGSLLFGLGWGLGGICPGPGLVALLSGVAEVFVFVAMMAVGAIVWQQQQKGK